MTRGAGKPYFGHLPTWIYEHPSWTNDAPNKDDRLDMADRWMLTIISGQCDTPADDEGSRRTQLLHQREVLFRCDVRPAHDDCVAW